MDHRGTLRRRGLHGHRGGGSGTDDTEREAGRIEGVSGEACESRGRRARGRIVRTPSAGGRVGVDAHVGFRCLPGSGAAVSPGSEATNNVLHLIDVPFNPKVLSNYTCTGELWGAEHNLGRGATPIGSLRSPDDALVLVGAGDDLLLVAAIVGDIRRSGAGLDGIGGRVAQPARLIESVEPGFVTDFAVVPHPPMELADDVGPSHTVTMTRKTPFCPRSDVVRIWHVVGDDVSSAAVTLPSVHIQAK